jgi:hypothetical protein
MVIRNEMHASDREPRARKASLPVPVAHYIPGNRNAYQPTGNLLHVGVFRPGEEEIEKSFFIPEPDK